MEYNITIIGCGAIGLSSKALDPILDKNEFSYGVVGLQPMCKEIRLEKKVETNINHNYGHGGRGYTIAWAIQQAY